MKVRVRVIADARREKFAKKREGEFSASVKEPAQRNAANARVRELVAAHYGVPVSAVRFITGTRGQNKVFDVR